MRLYNLKCLMIVNSLEKTNLAKNISVKIVVMSCSIWFSVNQLFCQPTGILFLIKFGYQIHICFGCLSFLVCIGTLWFFVPYNFHLGSFFAYYLYGCFLFQVLPIVISAMQMGLDAPRRMQSLAVGLNLLLRVIVFLTNLV